ncbi:Rieske (2Fe-2S) protein [Streptomyces sp. BPPL-273]|uniref:Rieske (2Fe-2S) protein n=1 Tax=Streptomyces TaxID=1883 RepID=UPI001CFA4296|nr:MULTISPECIES: Rieske (2Fe-2S) protein [Streptomyces]MCQ4197568.1 Rieske (2Fe-2S) protein [Streptomyces parvulus]WHM34091.1 Rieske (2Fe-2S) protein [Streptomyces sp. BPPL-273]WML79276.1 Rieske (2Fe-2S) protein [Streptomyces sp. VNUA74]
MTSASFHPAAGPARRAVVAAAGAAGLTAVLAACGGSDEDASGGGAASSGAPSKEAGGGDGGGGTELAATADIPEGGGMVFADQKVVVTQPSAGEFKAFSATCTHQGCAVKSVSDGVINCPCHNSNFSITDGSVRSGPAPKPLPAVRITVNGDSIQLAG